MSRLGSAKTRLKRLWEPAPLVDFSDYDDYWRNRGPIGSAMRRWTVPAEMIDDGASVLDVGCGSGEFLRHLVERRPGVRAVGVDPSAEAVALARDLGVEVLQLDPLVDELPGRFDFVTCLEVLEHVGEAEELLLRLRASFRKKLIVSIPNVGHIGCRLRLGLFGRFPVTGCYLHIKEHLRHWTRRDFEEWVERFDLKVTAYVGQYGMTGAPWKLWPTLFATGMIYVVEHAGAVDGERRS